VIHKCLSVISVSVREKLKKVIASVLSIVWPAFACILYVLLSVVDMLSAGFNCCIVKFVQNIVFIKLIENWSNCATFLNMLQFNITRISVEVGDEQLEMSTSLLNLYTAIS